MVGPGTHKPPDLSAVVPASGLSTNLLTYVLYRQGGKEHITLIERIPAFGRYLSLADTWPRARRAAQCECTSATVMAAWLSKHRASVGQDAVSDDGRLPARRAPISGPSRGRSAPVGPGPHWDLCFCVAAVRDGGDLNAVETRRFAAHHPTSREPAKRS